MKYSIISDIHANLIALLAIEPHLASEVRVLGDVIGYGPRPKECLNFVRQRKWPLIIGNHEIRQIETKYREYFSDLANSSAEFTARELDEDDLDFLRQLPFTLVEGDLFFSHGSPYEPEQFHYLTKNQMHSARTQLAFGRIKRAKARLGFVGHTHDPGIFSELNGTIHFTQLKPEVPYVLNEEYTYIVNVGSVGQPRNGLRSAQFIDYDSDKATITLRALEYDIEETAKEIHSKNLPDILAQRLFRGI